MAGLLRGHAGPRAHGELEPLGHFGHLGAGPERDPLLRRVDQAQPGIVDGQENPYSVILSNKFFEVQTDHHGRVERFYEWVDLDTGVVLKLVSRDRDWSFEYERFRLSPQPAYYFEEPPGYKKRMMVPVPQGQG